MFEIPEILRYIAIVIILLLAFYTVCKRNDLK